MDTTALTGSALTETPAPPVARRTAVPPLCETGVILRTLLFVQAVVAVAAGFGAGDVADWLERTALGAAVAVPATLAWLVVACSITGALARVAVSARLAGVAVLGGLTFDDSKHRWLLFALTLAAAAAEQVSAE